MNYILLTFLRASVENNLAIPAFLEQRCAAITQANSSSNSDRLPAWLLGSFLFLFAGQVHAQVLVAVDDSFGIPFGEPLQVEKFGVLENDTLDGENAGETGATAELRSSVTNGTLSCPKDAKLELCTDGSFDYMPGSGFSGTDSFTYRAVYGAVVTAPVTVSLTACTGGPEIYVCWQESSYLDKLVELGYNNTMEEGFEGPAWDAVRTTINDLNTAPSITSQGITWTTNHPFTNEITTGSGAARTGDYGGYDPKHGVATGSSEVCDVDNPPEHCLYHDGLRGKVTGGSGVLHGVGGYIDTNSGGTANISIVHGGIQTTIGKLPSGAGFLFFGLIDAGASGFTEFEFRELDGKIGQAIFIFADDITIGFTGTVPVTIAYLQASHKGNQLSVEWSTATETSNIGFNIYAVVLGEWIKLNDAPVPGSLDSLEPQHYKEIVANPYADSLTEMGIAGVDVDGKEDRHGPYVVGKARGERPHAEKINWKQVRSEMKAGLNARKARKVTTAVKGKNINKRDVIHVDVAESGLYRITDQDLRAAGLAMPRIEAGQIAVSFRGAAVARHIGGLNNKGEWNGKSWIEFIAEAPAGRDAVYLNANRYQLSRDAALVLDAPAFDKPEVAPTRFEANNKYAFSIPAEDPWYDDRFYAIGSGRPGALSRDFDLPGLQQGEAELMIYTSALSQGTHHMLVELNGTVIGDVQTEGWTPWLITLPVSSSLLKETGNVLSLKLPGDTSDFDYVLYDKLEVSYPHDAKSEILSASLQRAEKVNRNSLSRGRADLLVISHPALMGEALDGYIADRDAEGWSTKLVDVYDIYQAYGYGMATPSAITDYLDDANEMGYTHVQLVGAASYDYRDYLDLGSVNFIPSIYQRTAGIINYTPCDSCLVMDESLKPAAAIGRWPVHSPAELQAVINKGRAWANGPAAAHTSLLIADANEGRNDYISQVEETTKQLVETDGWNEPARVYLDDAIAAAVGDVDAGVAAAKADLIAALEAGASITVFSGHGAPSMWSFKRLLRQQDIAGIQNTGKPTLALPLTCYTTYAQSPYTSSLAHQLMVAGENAAVAVYGAATLSNFSHNSIMGQKVISNLLAGQTLGESIMNGKRDLNSSYRDVIVNSNLLGDVTLKLQ